MAEAFEIIGLASSIVAFVDFSIKLVSAVKSARDSVHDTLPEVHEIELCLEDVRHSNLRAIQGSPGRHLSQGEKHIMAMATECERLAGELGEIVQKLKIRDGARFRTIESSRIALRVLRKGKDIEDLRRRIDNLDVRIRGNVQLILDRERGSEILSDLNALRESQRQLGINYDSKLDGIQKDILRLAADNRRAQGEQLAALKEHLDLLEQERITCQRQSRIIRSLYFPELRRRWSQITDADQFTNAWLFDPTRTNFVEWLKDGDGIYWISGKAGSGKSTLMKFAAEHENTAKALEEWAGSSQLFTASYYFWNQGFEMQKSQVGLLQSLLYQILRRAPTLIPHVCSDDRLDHERWEINELKTAFEALAKHSGLSTKFCFFIDGLDEYDGEEEDVVSFLTFFSGSKLADIKICASSRPRQVFKPFQERVYSLAVQDFTSEDMKTHVRQRLQMNEKFKALGASQPGCEELMAQIAQQSQGVWLWVFLVTRDLVHAVNRNEGFSTLQRILRLFPPDLEAYFEHIIEGIKPVFRVEMAQIFLITTEEVQPLPLFAFSLLERESRDSDYAVKAPISPSTKQEVSDAEDQWKSRIQNRCGDLLIVNNMPHPIFLGSPVDFLHRTVRDFLQDCYHQRLVEIVTPQSSFDPLVSLCRMTLFLLKSIPNEDFRSKSSINRVIGLTDELLYYAHEVEKRSQAPDTADSPVADLLDELDRVNCEHARSLRNRHWTQARDLPKSRGYEEYREGGNCNFLALTVQARLVKYVQGKLAADSKRLQKAGRPLLDYALRPRRVTAISMPYHSQRDDPSIDVNMVRLLLDNGASVNQKVHLNDGRTVWALFLLSCYESTTRGEATAPMREAWYQASELLCQHGADPQCWLDDNDASMNVAGVMDKLFGRDRALHLQSLMAEAQTRKQPNRSSWLSAPGRFWRMVSN
ncbi:hypothetical protein NCS55_00926500 [Fusarium keratoplasticum]|nr:hypothetical protein NCS55_00926500 [Fusarium keratoplasticum]